MAVEMAGVGFLWDGSEGRGNLTSTKPVEAEVIPRITVLPWICSWQYCTVTYSK